MSELIIAIIKILGVAWAFVSFVLSIYTIFTIFENGGEKIEHFALKLIDYAHTIEKENVDQGIKRISLFLVKKIDTIFGEKIHNPRPWFISCAIVFTYCFIYYILEIQFDVQTSFYDQLQYWFIASVIADVSSIYITKQLLIEISNNPRSYFVFLLIDLIFVVMFYYFSFTYSMYIVSIKYPIDRVLVHPFLKFGSMVLYFKGRETLVHALPAIMALSTIIPTIFHFFLTLSWIGLRFLIPKVTKYNRILIEFLIQKDTRILPRFVVLLLVIFFLPLFLLYVHYTQKKDWENRNKIDEIA